MSKRNISAQMVQRVINTYGNECWLQFPGCTHTANTTDHILPWSAHGATTLVNLRRACKHCNSLRGNRVVSGLGATITAVIGAPASGKSTYVRTHMRSGDIVLDFDQLVATIHPSLADPHQRPEYIVPAVRYAWLAMYSKLVTITQPVHVWLIKCIPTTDTRPELWREWIALNYDIVVCEPSRQVLQRRLQQQDRVKQTARMVKQWYRLGLTQAKVDQLIAQRREYMASIGVLYRSSRASNQPLPTQRFEW